jgi:serine protease Do
MMNFQLNRPFRTTFIALLACLASSLGAGSLRAQLSASASSLDANASNRAQAAYAGAMQLSEAFRLTADQIRPSVVTISSLATSQTVSLRGMINGREVSPEELKRFLPPEFWQDLSPGEQRQQTGLGSGIIVSSDGYILTNNHVVEGADELEIELFDGRLLNAKIVGRDPQSDVAVLKVDARDLRPAKLGDSSAMQVGDWVVAIGSPFGLEQTVTAGIISATNRQTGIIANRTGGRGYEDFLQTDAAINPGNSGGPLVNLRGEVIGINTAINSRTGSNTGIGFAIPSNMASMIMQDLKTSGEVVRGYIGAYLEDLTARNAESYNLPETVSRAAIITKVAEGQPAAQSGLQADDVVTRIGKRRIRSMADMQSIVAMTRPGSQLNFEVYRDGAPVQIPVTVGRQTKQNMSPPGRFRIQSLGLGVLELTPRIAQQLDLPEDTGGFVVVELDRSGAAMLEMGLQIEDIIIEVNGSQVATIAQLREALLSPASSPRLTVIRQGRLIRVPRF